MRQNDKSKELNYEQILQLQYDRGQRSFEDEIVESADLSDIDDAVMSEYKSIMNITDLTNEEVLRARYFLVDGKLTNAGILLLGKIHASFYLKRD